MLGGVLLHHRHVLRVILQVLIQVAFFMIAALKLSRRIVLSGRQPDVAPVCATLARGETTSRLRHACNDLMLFPVRNADRFFTSSSLFG